MQGIKYSRGSVSSDRKRSKLKKQLSDLVFCESLSLSLSLDDMSREIYRDFLNIFSEYDSAKHVKKGGASYGRKRQK